MRKCRGQGLAIFGFRLHGNAVGCAKTFGKCINVNNETELQEGTVPSIH